jgi:GntR family transcriptional regulator/MocR family aminotransferase
MRPAVERRSAWELLLEVELRPRQMRRAVAETLRRAIQEGRLPAQTVLPSSRRLAAELGVSRGVVTDVYEQLAAEGYIEVSERVAPVVAAVLAAAPATAEEAAPSWRFDLNAVTPDVSLFPRRAWARAIDRALRAAPDSSLDYADHRGRPELRVALSRYLARVRGVRVDPGRIVITQGFTQALDLLCRVLVGRDAGTVAMESPSHPGLWATVRNSGLALVGCPVDGDGLDMDELISLGADAAVVAPAHQFPTGTVLAPRRRAALVDWASEPGRLIIEDDYDAEFRYDRTAVGAVQGLSPASVAHVGSASKSLAPGVRLGWISAPPDFVDALREQKSAADSGSPVIDQLALAELITGGEYERHIVRTRRTYRRRRDLLVGALRSRLPRLAITGAAAGMQLLVLLPEGVDDAEVAEAARTRRIGVSALSPLHLTPRPERGLLLGYGRLPEPSIREAVAALADVIEDVAGR